MSRARVIGLTLCLLALGLVLGFGLSGGWRELESGEPEAEVHAASTVDLSGIAEGRPEEESAVPSRKDHQAGPRRSPLVRGRQAREAPGRGREQLWERSFDESSLVEAGYSLAEVQRLKRGFEEARHHVLETLGVDPTTAMGSGFPSAEARELGDRADRAFRQKVEQRDLDSILYATATNRVELQGPSQWGAKLGLRKGDLLIAYEGQPIYTTAEYLDLMRVDRDLGRAPVLTFARGTRIFERAVPEGVVGAALRATRVAPR